jgi:hypothetical protein
MMSSDEPEVPMARKQTVAPDTSPLARSYLDLLAEEGYRPKRERCGETSGVITFKSEGDGYILLVDGDDSQFFHLATAYALDALAPTEALERANRLNDQAKAVKVTVHPEEGAVRFHIEAFVGQPVDLEVFERSLGAIKNAATLFFRPAPRADHLDA